MFPIPTTILVRRSTKLDSKKRSAIIIVAWVVYLLIGLSGNSGTATESTTTPEHPSATQIAVLPEKVNEEIVENSSAEVITDFVEKYNTSTEEKLVYSEDFIPSDKQSSHYRVEFRLTAYNEAVGKSYTYGDAIVDIIERKDYFGKTIIRVYVANATLDQCCEILSIASPILDEKITDEELQSTLDYIKQNKRANGYYYANLGIVVLGSDKNGYELMLKMGND